MFCVHRFSVENFVIEKHVRYILTVYPVVIYALSGSLSRNYDAAAPGRNAVFTGALETSSLNLCHFPHNTTRWRIELGLKKESLYPLQYSNLHHFYSKLSVTIRNLIRSVDAKLQNKQIEKQHICQGCCINK